MLNKFVKYFSHSISNVFEQETNNCLLQIEQFLQNNNLNTGNILSISIFIRVQNDKDFNNKKLQIIEILKKQFSNIPPITFIAQSPFHKNIACELIIGIGDFLIKDYAFKAINFRKIDYPDYSEIFSSGIETENLDKSFLSYTEDVFQKIKNILIKKNLSFSNIIRQWNYIENILSMNDETQNYQALNRTRTKFYSEFKWDNGYPAATGIGMNAGKVVINFIILENSKNVNIFPIHSPKQTDAHKYSENVLISNIDNKQTPKFERGKIIFYKNNVDFYVSGTAAIEGEKTIKSINVENQTKIIFENIKSLISSENLKNNLPVEFSNKIQDGFELNDFSNFRIYVKNEFDIPKVKKISKKYIKTIPTIFLVADICRENLSVEIEGNIFQQF